MRPLFLAMLLLVGCNLLLVGCSQNIGVGSLPSDGPGRDTSTDSGDACTTCQRDGAVDVCTTCQRDAHDDTTSAAPGSCTDGRRLYFACPGADPDLCPAYPGCWWTCADGGWEITHDIDGGMIVTTQYHCPPADGLFGYRSCWCDTSSIPTTGCQGTATSATGQQCAVDCNCVVNADGGWSELACTATTDAGPCELPPPATEPPP